MVTSTPNVSMREMNNALKTLNNSAPNFNPALVAYVDRCTVERDSFDFYSWKYWGLSAGGSICAVVSDTYNSYLRFRKNENRNWQLYWQNKFGGFNK